MTKYNLCIYHIIYNISSDTERVFFVFVLKILWSPPPILMPSNQMLFFPTSALGSRVFIVLFTGDVLCGDHFEQAGPGTGDGGLATSSSRQLSLQ